ncbi:tyrosine-type recombinase/integrase [Alkalibacillus sp. S2W]|uniref:tyrosine-type recombinase/integrase n=1 Tax=Alkalibacillus sp. S2W TaxID=3386553 RepID=UPI00398C8D4C
MRKLKRQGVKSKHNEQKTAITNKTANLTLKDMHRIFIRYKKADGMSQRTIDDYEKTFGYFLDYLDGNDVNRNDLTPDLFLDYKTFLIEKYSPNTVNVRLRTMHAFLKFCYEEGYINEALNMYVKKVRAPIDNLEALEVEEIERLIGTVSRYSSEWFTDFRNKVIILTLLDSMARVSELMQAKRRNLNLEEGILYLEGSTVKTRQGRAVPLSYKTCKLLSELLRETADFDSDLIFLTYTGTELTSNTVRAFLRDYAKEAGINKQVSPHVLRHTGALFYIMNGGDPFSLQKILGHKDMSMTRRYVQMASANVKDRHENFSPLNGLAL